MNDFERLFHLAVDLPDKVVKDGFLENKKTFYDEENNCLIPEKFLLFFSQFAKPIKDYLLAEVEKSPENINYPTILVRFDFIVTLSQILENISDGNSIELYFDHFQEIIGTYEGINRSDFQFIAINELSRFSFKIPYEYQFWEILYARSKFDRFNFQSAKSELIEQFLTGINCFLKTEYYEWLNRQYSANSPMFFYFGNSPKMLNNDVIRSFLSNEKLHLVRRCFRCLRVYLAKQDRSTTCPKPCNNNKNQAKSRRKRSRLIIDGNVREELLRRKHWRFGMM
jgi:hypothetical protein